MTVPVILDAKKATEQWREKICYKCETNRKPKCNLFTVHLNALDVLFAQCIPRLMLGNKC